MTFSDIRSGHSIWHINRDILAGFNSNLLSDMKSDILSGNNFHILTDVYFGILSDKNSDIRSGIGSDILSVNSDILPDIDADILSDIDSDRLRSGGHRELALEVRVGTLPSGACRVGTVPSGACGWGPTGNTAIVLGARSWSSGGNSAIGSLRLRSNWEHCHSMGARGWGPGGNTAIGSLQLRSAGELTSGVCGWGPGEHTAIGSSFLRSLSTTLGGALSATMGGPYLLPGGALPSLERDLFSFRSHLRCSSCKRNLSEKNTTKSGPFLRTSKNQKGPRIPSLQCEILQNPGPVSRNFQKPKRT